MTWVKEVSSFQKEASTELERKASNLIFFKNPLNRMHCLTKWPWSNFKTSGTLILGCKCRRLSIFLMLRVPEMRGRHLWRWRWKWKRTSGEGKSPGRVQWFVTERQGSQDSSDTCYDVPFGDGGTDKKTRGQALDVKIFIGSDQNGQS